MRWNIIFDIYNWLNDNTIHPRLRFVPIHRCKCRGSDPFVWGVLFYAWCTDVHMIPFYKYVFVGKQGKIRPPPPPEKVPLGLARCKPWQGLTRQVQGLTRQVQGLQGLPPNRYFIVARCKPCKNKSVRPCKVSTYKPCTLCKQCSTPK